MATKSMAKCCKDCKYHVPYGPAIQLGLCIIEVDEARELAKPSSNWASCALWTAYVPKQQPTLFDVKSDKSVQRRPAWSATGGSKTRRRPESA